MGDGAAAPQPESVLVQNLTRSLGLQSILAFVKWAQHRKGTANQIVIGEGASPPGHTFICKDCDQGVDAILRLRLVSPTAFGGPTSQAGCSNFTDLHVIDHPFVQKCALPASIPQGRPAGKSADGIGCGP